jgi:hypothetical protein
LKYSANIVRVIKLKKLKRLGLVACMEGTRNVFGISATTLFERINFPVRDIDGSILVKSILGKSIVGM